MSKPKFGPWGSSVQCMHCGNKVSVLVYGRHKKSLACVQDRKVNQAVADLKLNTFDVIVSYASVTIRGKPVRALAVGLDKSIDALTVVHKDGAVRQYLSGEWGPAKDAVRKGGRVQARQHRDENGIGRW